jgi:hypothetical protein
VVFAPTFNVTTVVNSDEVDRWIVKPLSLLERSVHVSRTVGADVLSTDAVATSDAGDTGGLTVTSLEGAESPAALNATTRYR